MEHNVYLILGKRRSVACHFGMDALKEKNAPSLIPLIAHKCDVEQATGELLPCNTGNEATFGKYGGNVENPEERGLTEGSKENLIVETQLCIREMERDLWYGMETVYVEESMEGGLDQLFHSTSAPVNTFRAERRMRSSCLNWEESYLLTGTELLQEVCRDPRLCKYAARSLYEFSLSHRNLVQGTKIVVSELIHFAMNSVFAAIIVSKLVFRLNAMLYVFYEGKSFAQYFLEGLLVQIDIRVNMALVDERDKLRFLLVLCSDLMRKFPPESTNAMYFQNIAFQLMRYQLLHKTKENIRVMTTVLADYGEIMFHRCSREVQDILQYFEVAAYRVLPRTMAQDVVNRVLQLRCQWEDLS
ncbi:hypothetical protein M514_10579 [Trichuris suis]|uniref:Uncharacterized protein n=1 Tax=Trichuris suis TaxID=68888 RepID=A0A085NPP9_9BILA|nr:hypothetical protein M513_10579 [Trichuris suis]KFD71445.1 hypothetical protein M514_10579 [Trichuris suis]